MGSLPRGLASDRSDSARSAHSECTRGEGTDASPSVDVAPEAPENTRSHPMLREGYEVTAAFEATHWWFLSRRELFLRHLQRGGEQGFPQDHGHVPGDDERR